MANNSKTVQTVPFNYDELYTELKGLFNEEGYDVAEGSNVSMLNSSMAYMTSMLNANTAVNINENILEYAQKRENVLQDARMLGYEIKHIMSYVYDITVTVPAGKYTIPKYTYFTSGDHTYYYTGEDIYIESDEETSLVMRAKEGTLHKYEDEPDILETSISSGTSGNQYYVDVPYTNVENDGIYVYLSYYDTYDEYHSHELWYRTTQTIIDDTSDFNQKYLRIDNIQYGTPRIYFKYAGQGNDLSAGTVVDINVLVSSGTDGEIDSSSVSCNLGYTVTNVSLVQSGQAAEGLQSIKNNAPKIYNSANRLVVANDYEAACNRDTRVSDTCVWGGEREFPISPGHIWFSFKKANSKTTFSSDDSKMTFTRDGFDNNWSYIAETTSEANARTFYENFYIMNTEIRSDSTSSNNVYGIWNQLDDYKIPTLEYHHRNPIFCTFDYDISILKYSLSENMTETHQEIFDIIDNAFLGEDDLYLESFNQEYFNASIIKRIDKKVTDISGFKLSLENHLVLNTKTLCAENTNTDLRDLYIPLGMPFEKIFDKNGFLDFDVLPNIDTEDFITYQSSDGYDLYTDWSAIKEEIANGIPQDTYKLILAPVKIKLTDEEIFNEEQSIQDRSMCFRFRIYPDNPSDDEPTYDNTKVWYTHVNPDTLKDETFELTYGAETHGWTLGKKPHTIILSSDLDVKSMNTVKISAEQICGYYYIFNNLKQEILVHFFVDGSVSAFDDYTRESVSGITEKTAYLYTLDDYYMYTSDDYYMYTEGKITRNTTHASTSDVIPKSYMYSSDGSYFYTSDNYYLTTEGYAVYDANSIDTYTGSVVRKVNTNNYYNSPLKTDTFYRNRYLNLKYSSNNFKMIKNVVPILRNVTFHNELN